MIISYDFRVDLLEYAARGKENDFPILDACPNCKCIAYGNIHRNGYYWRYGVTDEETMKIPICRMRCLVCKKSFSVLPDFLIPYFQHTIHTILKRIHQFLQKKKANGSRQLLRFHLIRYYKCLNWIHSFFTDLGKVLGVSKKRKKEATKYMIMILDFGESSFLRRSWGHLSKHFMAN
ncbi:DUF6431 domain-containing protein [Priestia flexa]|uniref:DUF6431 domain-containing protein n=1 Tax=Priestia flexa TaxID=86664 RepID=UPI001EF4DBC7|nr:DUF6431 domain-containing protein [Priestia flexa]MCG7314789.1 DUF6431 domain-containing protein [Priestia flexa]